MSENDSDRRRFQRIAFEAVAELKQDDKHWRGLVHDLSLHGMLMERPVGWDGNPQQPLLAHVELGAGVALHMEMTLVRDEQDALALACQHIDLDSISHLRRLVELNSGDPELLERELAMLVRL